MVIFALKFASGMMQGQKKLCRDGNGNKTCGDGEGMGTRSAEWGGARDGVVGNGWGWVQTADPCSSSYII